MMLGLMAKANCYNICLFVKYKYQYLKINKYKLKQASECLVSGHTDFSLQQTGQPRNLILIFTPTFLYLENSKMCG